MPGPLAVPVPAGSLLVDLVDLGERVLRALVLCDVARRVAGGELLGEDIHVDTTHIGGNADGHGRLDVNEVGNRDVTDANLDVDETTASLHDWRGRRGRREQRGTGDRCRRERGARDHET